MYKKLQHYQCVNPGGNVIHHDSSPLGQSLQLPDRRRLHNIEPSKKYKARQHGFPCHSGE